MSLHTDRVRAIGIFKARRDFTPEEINESAPKVIEHIRSLEIIKKNITKYEVAYKVEKFPKSLASELGLKESEYTTVIIIESTSHEKIREALSHPDYLAVIKGALENATDLDHFHFFSAEFVTLI
ncbi:hypothetical protein DFH08DRAFT_1082520 [Mycena albidolilacea]|uniref:Stress-response A/B barrel domain-containing protein n=1 Tax=Mycena albidolilacea TaxID=1033008 RepID=A0AAD7EMK2_9AGAR|nr:hypothetical protein DFH08DRAFT_1082520 [Mycena albidolilacea]